MKFFLLFACISIAIVYGAEAASIRDKRETFAQGLENKIRAEFERIIENYFLVVHEVIENMTHQQEEMVMEASTMAVPEESEAPKFEED